MTAVYILIGLCGGIIGGMGMGGGTLLIPLLTVFCSTEQHIAQSVNLMAFIPMSIIAVIIHLKNKLIKGEYFWWIAPVATVTGVLASLLVKNTDGAALGKYFGLFLTALGAYQLVCAIKSIKKERENGYVYEEEQ